MGIDRISQVRAAEPGKAPASRPVPHSFSSKGEALGVWQLALPLTRISLFVNKGNLALPRRG
jgi:hypothetical protein